MNINMVPFSRLTKILLLSFLFYGISYWLLYYYTGGDQVSYSRYYDALQYADHTEVLDLAHDYVYSGEPLSAYFLWIGAKLGFPKNFYISVSNVVLLWGVYLLTLKFCVPWPISFLLFSNYYLVVVLTSAERLKFAYIVLLFSSLAPIRYQPVLSLVSISAHFQSIILLAAILFSRLKEDLLLFLFRLSIREHNFLKLAFLFLAPFVVIGMVNLNTFSSKLDFYSQRAAGLSNIANLSILAAVSLYSTCDRLRMSMLLFPLALSAFRIGGDRINMIAFTLVIYFLMMEKRLTSLPVVFLLSYFTLKSLPFVRDIYVHGDGWWYMN